MALVTHREPFPSSTGASCSVIVPVFNGLDYTRRCITALLEDESAVPFELIVVDNGSTDGVEGWLETVGERLTLVRPAENLGFARANNLAARRARGEFLLLLNNDTIPTPDWLDAMVRTALSDDRIGVVGAKLLYPQTNLIQHAGVAIEPPLAVQHIYEYFPEDHPAVNRRREFQAVTAACMLVRGELYRKLGGFDEQFVNGYEDLDFCFRVREEGYRIVYEPAAVVQHFAGKSAGRKDHEIANGRLLYSRWFGRIAPDIEDIVREDGFIFSRNGENGAILPAGHNLPAELTAARKLLQEGRLLEAERAFRKLYYLAPHSHEALGYLERIYMKMGAWEEAWVMGQRLALFKPDPDSLLRLADSALKRGAFDLAKRYADGVLDMISFDDLRANEALAICGDAQFKLGDLVSAKKSYIQGIASPAPSPRCLVGAGAVALAEARYSEATPHFSAAVEAAPQNARARLGLALALENLGDFSGALKSYRLAVECDPDNGSAILATVRLYSALGRLEEARGTLGRYLVRWPDDVEALAAAVDLALQASRPDEASKAAERLKAYAPEHPKLTHFATYCNGRTGST